jgi:hypothetical protein
MKLKNLLDDTAKKTLLGVIKETKSASNTLSEVATPTVGGVRIFLLKVVCLMNFSTAPSNSISKRRSQKTKN